jgi:hypothetical protein
VLILGLDATQSGAPSASLDAQRATAVVASQQFGLEQTDAFAFDANGRLDVAWVVGARRWTGPIAIEATTS